MTPTEQGWLWFSPVLVLVAVYLGIVIYAYGRATLNDFKGLGSDIVRDFRDAHEGRY